jgi:hypothetical protein
MAFVDTPGVTQAIGFPAGTFAVDVSTGASLLMNMKRAFDPGGDLASTGPRFKQQRTVVESAASAVYGAGLNEASVTRVTAGMSSEVWRKGGQLQSVNATAAPSEAFSSIPVTNVHASFASGP